MSQRLLQIDAFSRQPFRGNPAAVCLLSESRDDEWMQSVAQEMNLSETAFLLREDNAFRLRWFTPTVEVDLCGHATLASAHALWETGELDPNEKARFLTRSGLLTASNSDGWIALDFPAEPPTPIEPPMGLFDALGTSGSYVGKNRFDILVELESREAVIAVKPDFGKLSKMAARGVIVTSRVESGEFDFVSRFFAPACGIDEDPVCGSAHCCLVPYWSERLAKTDFVAFQASQRGGVLRLQHCKDRVKIAGQAVTVFNGELLA